MAQDSGGGWILLLIGTVALYNCSGDASEENDDEYRQYADSDYDGDYSDYATYEEEFDEDAARDEARSELASEGYDYSYGCTEDCSGHEAGWQWGAENGVAYGNSDSFHEGTMAFEDALDERVEEMRNDFESGY